MNSNYKKQSFYNMPKYIPYVKMMVNYKQPIKYSYYKLFKNSENDTYIIKLQEMPLEAPSYIKRILPPLPLLFAPKCPIITLPLQELNNIEQEQELNNIEQEQEELDNIDKSRLNNKEILLESNNIVLPPGLNNYTISKKLLLESDIAPPPGLELFKKRLMIFQ